MAITATEIPITLDLLARENGDWTQMAPGRVLVESVGAIDPVAFGDDGEPLSQPDAPKRRHLWVAGGSATQQVPIDEQARDDQPETVIVGVDAGANSAVLGDVAGVIARLLAHPEEFAVKRRTAFAMAISPDDVSADLGVDVSADMKAAISAALAG